ncbi:ABC transporter substrate-binding protein [Pseudonocardia sp. WMMC193]|uniref:ABC transporter substrate-binding protein n=1 Tax=Pseudonocardia sp. WMMC193 TaxID=2911965 RepID=UPI001F355E8B|nr:ABC transporter substrate-binding protein [Pseudonocardia sp. WMMC193]MCF7552729.1 ABC transporter substrate-binding protein [Pseudonocardia sp. WMMC193]
MRTRALARLVPLAAVAALALAGCAAAQDAQSSSGSSTDTANTPLVVAYSNPLNTLDPIRSDYNQTNTIADVAYDTLVTYDAQNTLVGSLATEFSLAPDATSVAITLRDGVTFHDGSPLTADDVAYTLDRYKKVGVGIASYLNGYGSTTVTDPTHLTITLTAPNGLFPGTLSKLYILEKALVTANAGTDDGQTWLQSHDAGSGPYAITTGTGDVVAQRFAGYWDFDAKRPSQYTFRRIDESPTKRDELKAGNLDIALALQSPDAAALAGADGVTVADLKVPNGAYMFMNTANGPTANVAVRKALQLAYDYSGGLDQIRGGKGTVENGPLPQTMPCLTSSPAFSQNLDLAKQTLAQAGITDLHLTMRFQPAITDQAREATLFQSDLRKIGVTLDLQPIAFADYLSSLGNPDTIPQLMLLQDTAALPDPGVYLTKAYDSKSTGTNRAAYHNPQVDALLDQAATTSDTAARCTMYQQAQNLINADAPSVSMYTLTAPVGYRTGLTGITASQTVYPLSLKGVRVA